MPPEEIGLQYMIVNIDTRDTRSSTHAPLRWGRLKGVCLRLPLSIALAAAIGVASSPTSHAEQPPTLSSLDLAELQANAPLAEASADATGYSVFAAQSQMTLPAEQDGNIEITTADHGEYISISLPEEADVFEGVLSPDGTLNYEARDDGGIDLKVLPFKDGSVAIHTVIPDRSSPKEYSYTLNLPEGASHMVNPDGSIFFVSEGEDFIAGIAAPWAIDADGNEVPSWYTFENGTLRQHVDLSGASKFPVTADPWLGMNLFKKISVDTYKSQSRVNLTLSTWGWAVYSGLAQGGGLAAAAAGQVILNKSGWSEATNWSSSVGKTLLSKTTMKQQFECHALGAVGAGEWNLEKFRPNRTVTWVKGVGVHHCNWTTATYY